MKTEYRFTLEPYKGIKTRYRCPSCNHKAVFTHYIDTNTGEHIHPSVGICERLNNCGYHYPPKQYFQENGIVVDKSYQPTFKPKPILKRKAIFIPEEIFTSTLAKSIFDNNHFIKYLIKLFGLEITKELIDKYLIGNSTHWNGATIFWQVDALGRVRAGKIMLYDPVTGKRVKSPYKHINWAHRVLNLEDFELKQCLFGEHLLKDNEKPVAIVESEKTAIIASAYFPNFTWLASGSRNNLNAEICSVLKGRKITLFPDLDCFKKWDEKAKALEHIASFTVSDLLERKASSFERNQGLDLADYLIRFDINQF